MAKIDLFEATLDGYGGVGTGLVPFWLACLEVVEGQVRCLTVAASDFMDNADGVLITTFSDKKLGRLVDGEENETDQEHDHGEAAYSNQKVTPTHVLAPGAASALLAGKVA